MNIQYIERSFFSLGTLNHIKIYKCKDESFLDLVENRVNEIDDMMSAFKPDSDISKLNSSSGKGFINIHEDTFNLLNRSLEFSMMSSGAFDITIRPLVELWGIGKKKNSIPSEHDIAEVNKLVNYNHIMLDHNNCRAALAYPGQAVDLGGIAKGFAADEVKRILVERNVESALINLGGNIITIGDRPDSKPWQIGIQNPLATRGQYIGILPLSDKTIVTSGSNERFFIRDGIRYHHILDPRTGKPTNTSILSVTVVASCSMDADALTTALFILGPESILGNGTNLIEKHKVNFSEHSSPLLFGKLDFEAIFITTDLEIIATNGLKEGFKVLQLT